MAISRYAILDDDGSRSGTEEFRCAPGPMGWRSFSNIRIEVGDPHDEIVDMVVDAPGRPVRPRIEPGSHSLLLPVEGDRLEGFRDREPISIPWSPETEIDYASPAFNVVTANRLR